MFKRRTGSSFVDAGIKRRNGSGWTQVQNIRRRSGSGWITAWSFYQGITASVPASVAASAPMGTTGLTSLVQTPHVTVTASGGSGSLSYSWQRVSGSTAISATNSAGSTTAFSGRVSRNSIISAVFRCRVSDGISTVYSNNITVHLDYFTDV